MTGSMLKLLALAAMTVDHIGLLLFPQTIWLRMVGRLAFPIFAFMAAEGARYTHDRRRYLLRLLLWAALTEPAYDLFCDGRLFSMETANVCWTLAGGVACCWLLETKKPPLKNWVLVGVILAVTTLFSTDYLFPGVLAVVFFYRYAQREQLLRGATLACLVLSLVLGPIQLLCFAALLPLAFYNGKRGFRLKYLFYIYYPAHMLVLWAVSQLAMEGALL